MSLYYMACVCRRYNTYSDWLIVVNWHYSPVMLTGRLPACTRTIGCKVISSAALVLAFLLYFCVP